MLPQFLKSICHYIFIKLPILFGLVGRETVSETNFHGSFLVNMQKQWFYISPTAFSRVCLCSFSGKSLRPLGVLDCAQAVGGASAVGADWLCLSLCAVSICYSSPDAGLPLSGYQERSATWTIVCCSFDPRNPIDSG